MIELGGNITLSGFQDREFAELIVIKKIVGQYARKLHDTVPGFQSLSVNLNVLGHQQHEISIKAMVDGAPYNSAVTERNLFVALDSALKKIVEQI